MKNSINMSDSEFWEYKSEVDHKVIELREKLNYHTEMVVFGTKILLSVVLIMTIIWIYLSVM